MKIATSILLYLIMHNCYGQVVCKSDTSIQWGSKELLWSDFNGAPPSVKERINFAAVTASNVYCRFTFRDDTMRFFVHSYFIKRQSWTIINSDYALNHERRHFDIAEIIARKTRQYFMSLEGAFVEKNTIQQKILKFSEERIQLQKDYDKETKHGVDKVKQEVWDIKIKKMLDSLEAYKQPYGKIIIKW